MRFNGMGRVWGVMGGDGVRVCATGGRGICCGLGSAGEVLCGCVVGAVWCGMGMVIAPFTHGNQISVQIPTHNQRLGGGGLRQIIACTAHLRTRVTNETVEYLEPFTAEARGRAIGSMRTIET